MRSIEPYIQEWPKTKSPAAENRMLALNALMSFAEQSINLGALCNVFLLYIFVGL